MLLSELEDLDHALIELLRQNARMPMVEIARKLGVSRPTASRRLDRLLQGGVLHLLAETDIYATGKDLLVVLELRVEGRPVTEVAAELAAMPQAIAVNTVAGQHDLEVLLVADSHQELNQLHTEEIPSIAGVGDRCAGLCLEVVKFESNLVPFFS
jgi:Lrp/AsnC family leucine-responsive transcriptional regulator